MTDLADRREIDRRLVAHAIIAQMVDLIRVSTTVTTLVPISLQRRVSLPFPLRGLEIRAIVLLPDLTRRGTSDRCYRPFDDPIALVPPDLTVRMYDVPHAPGFLAELC